MTIQFLGSVLGQLLPTCVAVADADSNTDNDTEPATLTATDVSRFLNQRFRKADGSQVSIVLMHPAASELDKNSYELVSIGIEKALARSEGFTLQRTDSSLAKLNMDELKRAAARAHAEVILATSFKPTRWSIFLYDRKSPFEVVVHSESLPSAFIQKPTDTERNRIVQNLVSQLFYQYAAGETFELPQEETKPLLQNEIPRWMASTGLIKSINTELASRYYFSASIGGVMGSGFEGRGTSSGLFGLQLGYRPFKGMFSQLVAEVSGQFFTYNAGLFSLKYYFHSKTTTARFFLGLGAASVSSRRPIAFEPGGNGLGVSSIYAVPSLAMVVPLGDLLFKLEAQYFTSIDDRSNSIIALMPGLFIAL